MKTARFTMLSVLLFAFTFFVFHDYVMVDVDADTQYELCYMEYDKTVMDLPSQIHDHIHVLLAAPDIEADSLFSMFPESSTFESLAALNSNTLSVPQRPPLA